MTSTFASSTAGRPAEAHGTAPYHCGTPADPPCGPPSHRANPLLNALAPAAFMAMRNAPGHFDVLAVPGPQSWASQQKQKETRDPKKSE